MTRILKGSDAIHPAPGFSHIAISSGSTWIHFAGQTALDKDFTVIGDSLYEQTRASMLNLEILLNEAGASWSDIVRRTIYTTLPTEYAVITDAIHSVTGDGEDPAQTIVGVTGLALPGLLIEIECTAVQD